MSLFLARKKETFLFLCCALSPLQLSPTPEVMNSGTHKGQAGTGVKGQPSAGTSCGKEGSAALPDPPGLPGKPGTQIQGTPIHF